MTFVHQIPSPLYLWCVVHCKNSTYIIWLHVLVNDLSVAEDMRTLSPCQSVTCCN